jgi:hypothetical protein
MAVDNHRRSDEKSCELLKDGGGTCTKRQKPEREGGRLNIRETPSLTLAFLALRSCARRRDAAILQVKQTELKEGRD